MGMTIAIGLVGLSIVGLIGLLVYYNVVKNKYKKNMKLYTQDKLQIKNKTNFKETTDKFYQSIYNKFVQIPVIKYYTKKTRLKLEMSNDYTEYEIRRQAAKNMFIALVFMFSTLTILLNLVNDLYMSLIIIVGVLIITEKMIDLRVTSVSDKILRQMPEAFTNIRHAFHEHGMIEESFNAAIDELGEKDIVPQLKRIKEAMLAEKPDIELERYYDTAPNRFLKLFAGVSYLTMELRR
jgi:ABC-type multidrug transport system fused ATPase/permease subunit